MILHGGDCGARGLPLKSGAPTNCFSRDLSSPDDETLLAGERFIDDPCLRVIECMPGYGIGFFGQRRLENIFQGLRT